ncbi:ShlB/FhaC/HecB family hemolysin secretion/activation protein [Hydrogenophaga sp.]|uniref:ShlB/FhaC/HecB family hemolysin secretion/activation protein n=1 Tax=Hydrogenophaga sp. TaxID=1904254 RepID=UPI0026355868|nr:ShlB/FhaC/HecB family hemolysin secretion/activation protein [Hydrogenophaga sp.]MCW5654800.1 ShlB/FhaC/HecB family hemolysin secretion/activation protein [Hydrogenophaga sp.]
MNLKTADLTAKAVPSLVLALAACGAWAQATAPTGGELYRQLQGNQPAVVPDKGASPVPQAGAVDESTPRLSSNGQRLPVRAIRFEGNTSISTEELASVIPPLPPEGITADELNTLADKVSRHYRIQGYPLARALLAAQTSSDGSVTLTIVEGRFGRVELDESGTRLRPGVAQRVLDANLCAAGAPCEGQPITDKGLQRATLLLSDLPGVQADAAFRRGTTFGTADLGVKLTPGQRYVLRLGADNYGSQVTGEWRGSTSLTVNEPFGIGDQFDASLIGSGSKLWNGSAAYSALVTGSGLRAGLSASHTQYTLGDVFAALDAHGTADVASAQLTYPLVRSLNANLSLGLAYNHKQLRDYIGIYGSRATGQIEGTVVSFQGDWIDGLLGGGYGKFSLSFTNGRLSGLDTISRAADQNPLNGLKTAGDFSKFNYLLERQQNLAGAFTLYGSVSGQSASKNLASAERYYLGGPTGVRAYPIGEGSGDTGTVATLELRHTSPARFAGNNAVLSYGLFYDHGWVRRNQRPLASATTPNQDDFGGAGLRVGLGKPGAYSVDLVWAQQTGSHRSLVEPGKRDRFWLQAAFQY